MAARYDREGADELVFLDITATVEGRAATLDVISQVAEQVFIPLTVGGGVQERGRRERAAARRRRQGRAEQRRGARAGAAAALRRPLRHAVHGGRDRRQAGHGRATAGRCSSTPGAPPPGATPWSGRSRPPAERGAGEVLLTSMDRDGTGEGYDLDLLQAVTSAVRVPVIASGGAGEARSLRRGAHRGPGGRRARGEPPALRRADDPRDQGVPGRSERVTVRTMSDARGSRSGRSGRPALGRPRADPGDRAGRRERRGPDAGLGQPRGARAHARRGPDGLLEPLAPGAVAQGRHQRPRPALGGAPRRLRRATRSSRGSTRRAPPVTRASGAASIRGPRAPTPQGRLARPC